MSQKHRIISVTGSSGAGTSTVGYLCADFFSGKGESGIY